MARHIGSRMLQPLGWWTSWAGLVIGSLESGTDLFQLNTTDAAARIAPRPIMIIHGTSDSVVPFQQGEKVYAAAGEPKWFHKVVGADHCQSISWEGRVYTDRMIRFLDEALAGEMGD